MAKPVSKKIAWVIKNFSSLNSDQCYSDPVLIGDCKWCLRIFPKGDKQVNYLSVYLQLDNYKSLPSGWRSYAKFRLRILNQKSQENSVQQELEHCFDQKAFGWGIREMLPLTKLHDKDGGFLVNDELMIAAEVDIFEIIGTKGESKVVQDDDGAESKKVVKKNPSEKESVDVNGFQVLPSQVEFVRRIFELHPDIASEFRGKNKDLRTAYMNFLLSLMKTLSQPLEELSKDDLVEADVALGYLKNANFKVDWLDTELDQVKEKKEAEQAQA